MSKVYFKHETNVEIWMIEIVNYSDIYFPFLDWRESLVDSNEFLLLYCQNSSN